MSITELLPEGQVAGWAITTLILFLSLIQISPLKLNPWDSIFAWIGKKMTGIRTYIIALEDLI